ncbi:MAG TPA: DEAD/DEAH box helicase [Aldersonia sp.]
MTAAPTQAASDGEPSASELAAYLPLLARLRNGRPPAADWSNIVDAAALVSARPGFDTLLAARQLRFEPFDYQIRAAQTVLRRMRGRGILADEVGLGKTIEAGLVLSELRLRGLAERTLVVTPAGIVGQWCDELERKFGLPTEVARPGRDLGADRKVTIASLAAARRAPMLPTLTEHEWDLVIFDEAHRLRNPRSASGRLAREIRTRYLLMLTATPVENRLSDLYQLVSLVAPGLLGTPTQFRSRHGGSTDAAARHVDELRTKTREVMVRHRRSEVTVLLPHRIAETVLVPPEPDEAELYADIVDSVRRDAATSPSGRLALRGLVRLAGSSPAAAAATLDKLGHADLAERARWISAPAKTRALVDTLARHVARGEKVLVFTGFRATLASLADAVRAVGLDAAVYHGSMARTDKDAAVARFAGDTPILLSTESAGEGRNLQFCHVLVNYDLPWNPMQIEQRVGRLHRVGQEHDVTLINLVGRDTIEQRIMSVLEAKINLFELVVGELDMILGRIDDDFDFETAIFDALIEADDDTEFGRRLDTLGDALAAARTGYLTNRTEVDDLIGGIE